MSDYILAPFLGLSEYGDDEDEAQDGPQPQAQPQQAIERPERAGPEPSGNGPSNLHGTASAAGLSDGLCPFCIRHSPCIPRPCRATHASAPLAPSCTDRRVAGQNRGPPSQP